MLQDRPTGNQISHPEKILFPPDVTKQDLQRYFRRIHRWILPYLLERPLALVRCPSGAGDKCFFQKHDTKKDRRTKDWIGVEGLEDILNWVNLNVLEFHVWGCLSKDLNHPDQVVFDLDPGAHVSWGRVVDGAFQIRDVLRKMKLVSFVKTTGGKGLHVVAPIERRQSWYQVRQFARDVAGALQEGYPELYVAASPKRLRERRIFIDYLRNGRGSITVAPYSTRAKKNAPVSTPIFWDELETLADPLAFTLKTVELRLAGLSRDPWEGFFFLKQKLPSSERLW